MKNFIIAGTALFLCAAAPSPSSLPNLALTPGATNPAVTQATIGETICQGRQWTSTIRPSSRYTNRLKRTQIRLYGYTDHNLNSYEEDHLIPLSLGGSPRDPKNLWPEPMWPADGWNAWKKDWLELYMLDRVCDRQMTLTQAQKEIVEDWHAAYQRYVGFKHAIDPTPLPPFLGKNPRR